MSNTAKSYIDYSNDEQDLLSPSIPGVIDAEKLGKSNFSILHNIYTKKETQPIIENDSDISSPQSLPEKSMILESIENEFICIINSVDWETESICASVYDVVDRIQLLEISAKFSEFLESEREKIIPNATFYWRIGARTITRKILGKKDIGQTRSFSEFRMRLSYVSPRSLEGRLESRTKKYSKLFA